MKVYRSVLSAGQFPFGVLLNGQIVLHPLANVKKHTYHFVTFPCQGLAS